MSDLSPLSGVKRKSDFGAVRAAFDPKLTYTALTNRVGSGPRQARHYRKSIPQACLRSASAYFAAMALSSASDRPGNARKSAGAVAFTAKVSCSHRVPKPVAPYLG